MKLYTIRCNGSIVGTFAGNSEEEAFDAMAVADKSKNFADHKAKLGLKRDDYKVEEVSA